MGKEISSSSFFFFFFWSDLGVRCRADRGGYLVRLGCRLPGWSCWLSGISSSDLKRLSCSGGVYAENWIPLCTTLYYNVRQMSTTRVHYKECETRLGMRTLQRMWDQTWHLNPTKSVWTRLGTENTTKSVRQDSAWEHYKECKTRLGMRTPQRV